MEQHPSEAEFLCSQQKKTWINTSMNERMNDVIIIIVIIIIVIIIIIISSIVHNYPNICQATTTSWKISTNPQGFQMASVVLRAFHPHT